MPSAGIGGGRLTLRDQLAAGRTIPADERSAGSPPSHLP